MTPSPPHEQRTAGLWGNDGGTVTVVAHSVSTRYLAYLVDAVLGLVMLPFNLAHLGMAAYGLWMLTTSFTTYFAMLDLGYGGALVRFVAQYRARRDAGALNEVLSTLSVVYTSISGRNVSDRPGDRVQPRPVHQPDARADGDQPHAAPHHRRQRRATLRVRRLWRGHRRIPALPPQQPDEHRHQPDRRRRQRGGAAPGSWGGRARGRDDGRCGCWHCSSIG